MNNKTKNVTLKGALLLIGISLMFMGYEILQSEDLDSETFLKGVILLLIGISFVVMREVVKKDVRLEGHLQSLLESLPEADREQLVKDIMNYLKQKLSLDTLLDDSDDEDS